jgi:hypothetical protein
MPDISLRRVRVALASACVLAVGLWSPQTFAQHRKDMPSAANTASRMVFKDNTQERSCQLTLMHVYTSRFNKKHTQFAFTGSVLAKRDKNQGMRLTVLGQNHELSAAGKGFKPFPLARLELGVEDVSVRRFIDRTQPCKKGHVCASYKDNKQHDLQTWVSDDKRNLNLLLPLVTKQPSVVIDLSKLGASANAEDSPLGQFKRCTSHLI